MPLLNRILLLLALCCAAMFSHVARAQNYSDIWWNPNESGWGLTLADHGTQLFGVWYTYAPNGRPTWYVIPGGTFTQGKRFFSADVYQTTGNLSGDVGAGRVIEAEAIATVVRSGGER